MTNNAQALKIQNQKFQQIGRGVEARLDGLRQPIPISSQDLEYVSLLRLLGAEEHPLGAPEVGETGVPSSKTRFLGDFLLASNEDRRDMFTLLDWEGRVRMACDPACLSLEQRQTWGNDQIFEPSLVDDLSAFRVHNVLPFQVGVGALLPQSTKRMLWRPGNTKIVSGHLPAEIIHPTGRFTFDDSEQKIPIPTDLVMRYFAEYGIGAFRGFIDRTSEKQRSQDVHVICPIREGTVIAFMFQTITADDMLYNNGLGLHSSWETAIEFIRQLLKPILESSDQEVVVKVREVEKRLRKSKNYLRARSKLEQDILYLQAIAQVTLGMDLKNIDLEPEERRVISGQVGAPLPQSLTVAAGENRLAIQTGKPEWIDDETISGFYAKLQPYQGNWDQRIAVIKQVLSETQDYKLVAQCLEGIYSLGLSAIDQKDYDKLGLLIKKLADLSVKESLKKFKWRHGEGGHTDYSFRGRGSLAHEALCMAVWFSKEAVDAAVAKADILFFGSGLSENDRVAEHYYDLSYTLHYLDGIRRIGEQAAAQNDQDLLSECLKRIQHYQNYGYFCNVDKKRDNRCVAWTNEIISIFLRKQGEFSQSTQAIERSKTLK